VKAAPDGTARVEFEVRFPATKGRRRAPRAKQESSTPPLKPVPPQVPRITQLLVLGHHFERLVQSGVVKDYAEIARATGLSRARITQVCDMALLPPSVQESILLR